MSKMTDFETLTRRMGKGTSFNDAIANFFSKTGKPATFLSVRSLKSQVAKELKNGGLLRDLVTGGVIVPSVQGTGRVAEWSVGLDPIADQTALALVPTQSQHAIERIVTNSLTNGNAFQMPETQSAVQAVYDEIERLPISKQGIVAKGMVELDFERRLAIKDTEALRKELADKVVIIALLSKDREPGTDVQKR